MKESEQNTEKQALIDLIEKKLSYATVKGQSRNPVYQDMLFLLREVRLLQAEVERLRARETRLEKEKAWLADFIAERGGCVKSYLGWPCINTSYEGPPKCTGHWREAAEKAVEE